MKKNDDCSITESENEVAKSLKNPNPKKTPKISGIVFLKPKFTALVERMILLGPGVIAAVIAKVKIGAIK